MNISVGTFLPIGEIHPVRIATGAKEQGGDIIGAVEHQGAGGRADGGF